MKCRRLKHRVVKKLKAKCSLGGKSKLRKR